MKKIILFSLVLFSIILYKNNLYSEDNIIYPLKKPILKPEDKEKKISINIIKPLKKPIIKKVEKKPKEEKINGNFEKGDHVLIKSQNNIECARGLTSFSSIEIDKVKGSHSNIVM